MEKEGTFYLLLGIIAVLTIIAVVLFILWGKQRYEKKAAVKAGKKLNQDYHELKQICAELTIANGTLSEKYDMLKDSKDKIEKIAYTDYLTELPNRMAFQDMLNGIMMTLRSDEIVGSMDIDLDNFKDVNDLLGHSYGDQLLIDVANRLLDALDKNDYLARIGGDEFAVITQNFTDISEYEEKIKKIQKLFSYPFSLANKEVFITISIGITMAPRDGKTAQALIKNMNAAMTQAKSAGRNTYVHFDESINHRLMEKMELQSDLRKAIEEDQFIVYYQAQINLNSNSVNGFEALLRWNHPVRGIVEPSQFIPLAEETGLIVPIGLKMMGEAFRQMKRWQEEGHDLKLAVNLSGRQFRDKELVNEIRRLVEEIKLDPRGIELEITETVALDDLGYTIETIETLKEMGFTFALDDFGTGYSSLSYLRVLPVNNLKIDKSFMDSVLDNNTDKKIVEAIIGLAQNLELLVVAEGVEKEEQEMFLKKIHCNKAQGFLYSKAVAIEEAEKLLNGEKDIFDYAQNIPE